ncbi:MAG: nucleotidyltransferase [Bacteroidetes bacterium GWA2_31_9]|nr:MAG: nucleotidyltransferase [Bacteroidetes bacterium GWA2_31_9]
MKINKQQLSELCKQHNVLRLYLFGSFAKNTETEQSDIDFLVKFNDVELYYYFDNYLSLKENLERIYQRKVDLLEEQTVKNPFLEQSINQSKILIYGQ